MRHPNLLVRYGRYYIRRRVPADILPIWNGGKFVTKSLQTSDWRIAIERLRIEQGNIQKTFDALKSQHAVQPVRLAPADDNGYYVLSEAEIEHLVERWLHEGLRDIESHPVFPSGVLNAQALCDELEQQLTRLSRPDQEVLDQELGPIIQRLLVRSGLPITKALGAITLQARDMGLPSIPVCQDTYRRLFAAIRNAEIVLCEARLSHIRGRSKALPTLCGDKRSFQLPYKLDDLIRDFTNDPARGDRTTKTELDYAMVFRAMRDVIGGQKLVGSVTREDCIAVRDLLLSIPRDATKRYPGKSLKLIQRQDHERPLKMKTVNAHLSKMSTVFGWAVAEHHRSNSPAEKLQIALSVESETEGRRRSFTTDELHSMFSAPLYTGCVDDERNFWRPGVERPRRSRFWIPLIALFSGLRQTEACQLTVADVGVVEGIDVIFVRKTEPGQKLKTKAARRYVPIHPELINIGLVRYATRLRNAGEAQLFPELTPDARGYKGAIFQKRFNSFRRSLGIDDPNAVFHSFRHTWRDAMRNARISPEMAQVLGGWAGGGQDQRYGSTQFSASLRFQDISRISFGGLDLGHLYEE